MTHKTQYKYNLKKTHKSNIKTFSKGLAKHVLIYFLMLIFHYLLSHKSPSPLALGTQSDRTTKSGQFRGGFSRRWNCRHYYLSLHSLQMLRKTSLILPVKHVFSFLDVLSNSRQLSRGKLSPRPLHRIPQKSKWA